MKVSAPSRTKGNAHQRSAFKLKPVAAGCAVLLFGMTGVAAAQEANLETVTVSGIRKGIEEAISVKKNADSIVEAISAEDIGKLPDASVAESISRLPGVTAQRNKSTGKAQSISVRGMSPDFNGALLNGREQASTGDSRGVEFDQFPAELLSGVTIYKTPDSALVGQGLSSTIDLRTVRPLDFSNRNVVINKRRQRSGIDSGAGEGTGDRTSLSYIDQFADRTIGVALGFVRYNDTGAEQQKFNSWGGWAADVPYNGVNVKTPGGFTADTEQSSAKREGTMASLQFRPNKNFESTLDLFRSTGTFALKKTGLEGAIGGQSAGPYDPSGDLKNATIANGVATSGTITNYKGVVRNHVESGDDSLKSWGWNNKLKTGDWTTILDLAQSKVSRDSTRYETTAGQPGDGSKPAVAAGLGTISWSGFNGSNFDQVKYTTSLNYSDRNVAKLTDVDGWSGGASSPQAGYVALPSVSDKVDNVRLSARRDVEFGPINATEIGVNFADREKIRTTKEGRLVIAGGDPYGAVTVPGSATAIAGTTGLPVVSWDPRGSLGSIYTLAAKVDADILNKDWSVKEKVTTAYIKNDVDGVLSGLPFKGNFGMQLVHTDQSSTGFNVDRAKCTGNTAATCPGATVGAGKTYDDFLPSANLAFNLGDDQVVRLGVAQVQARPNMGDMRASLGFSVDNTSGSKPILKGDGGNPELEPFRAKSFDLSYEKYFGVKGYISAAAFYKKLDTYILKTARSFDFKPYTTANTVLPVGGSTIGLLTTPFNGSGGNIYGVELAVNLPFSLLHKSLSGFGMFVNYSDTSSNVSLPASGFSTESVNSTNISLPGLSKKVTNMRAYYEAHGVQIALARRQRSDFLGEISDYQDNRQLTYVKGESIVDLQVSYEFQSGWFKGLSLLAQANNLTNAEFVRYNGDPSQVTERIKYGKTYLFGANYKF